MIKIIRRDYFIVYIVTALSISSFKYNQSEENKFVQWFFENTKISNTLQIETINIDSSDINHLFEIPGSLKNRKLILKQIKDNNEYFFKYGPLKNVRVISKEKINEINKINTIDFLRMTKPVFLSKDLIWIKVEHFCGNLCGGGNAYVYKKKETGYELIDLRMIWIS